MKQIILLISLSFLFTSQAMAAAAGSGSVYDVDTPLKASEKASAAKGFLDAYDPEKITPATFIPNVAPFGYFYFLGESIHGIKTDKKSNLEPWQAKLRKVSKAIQESAFTYEPARGDEPVPPSPIPWLSHVLAPRDYEIAEALFLVSEEWKGKHPTYTEVEFSTWEKLHGILGIPPLHKAKNPKEASFMVDPLGLATMDLWVFLMSINQRAWSYDPPLSRFEKPEKLSDTKSNSERVFLAKLFKSLVTVYCISNK